MQKDQNNVYYNNLKRFDNSKINLISNNHMIEIICLLAY